MYSNIQLRYRAIRSVIAAMALASIAVGMGSAPLRAGVSGAVFTTDSTCTGVDLNIYDSKDAVFLDGGPQHNSTAAGLDDGSYCVTVMAPGGRLLGINGAIHVTNHNFDQCYQLSQILTKVSDGTPGYDDTPNPGGVYIVAVCTTCDNVPRTCKYDAFKVRSGGGPPPEGGFDLTVSKTAAGTLDRAYTWTITKSVDKTSASSLYAGVGFTFNYTVSVSHNNGVDSNWAVTGVITVNNVNNFAVQHVNITDEINDTGASCSVDNGSDATIPANGSLTFTYSCSYSAAPASLDGEQNTVTITWPDQASNPVLLAGSAFDSVGITFTANQVDECVAVTDSAQGTLGTVCVGDANPKAFTYSRTIPTPASGCQSYDNTATFTSNDTGATGSAGQTVTLCRIPPVTGALTIGFWQNKNGQGIINNYAGGTSGTSLRTYLRGFNPFQDLSSTATASQVASYVSGVIKAANASGAAMNAMLKAQMLATALDVYFSTPALGGNRINAPGPIGSDHVDLATVCKCIDGTGGTATCSGVYENVSSAFGGSTCLTVSQMLTYAAGQSNSGGSVWYGQVKATQGLAKDAFDAINNQVAYACP